MPAPAIRIRPLVEADRAAWEPLWNGYNEFYREALPAEVTEASWRRWMDPGSPMHLLGAERDGRLIAFTAYLFHASSWSIGPYCYLEDLFTAAEARGTGAGEALITAVAEAARASGATRLYWVTHETNAVAQRLYDRVAERTGFIQYRKVL